MKHLSEGKLRAFYDRALSARGLSAAERGQVQQHLETCARCAARATLVRERGRRVHTLLAGLEPRPGAGAVAPQIARRQLDTYLWERKEQSMARNPFSRRYRPAWAAAALVLLVMLTLTVPPVRTWAGDLLRLFRVQKIEFTPVDPEALPDEETLEAVAPEIQRMFDKDLTITTDGERETVDEATARARAGFSIRLPATEQEEVRYEWTPPVHVAMQVDLPRLRTLFAELGYRDVELPDTLGDRTVEADFQGMLTAAYGACEDERPPGGECMAFVQMPSPAISVPDDLDIDQLGRVYLELLGMTDEEAARLSDRIDWTTTLVVPFPNRYDLAYETVRVDGVEATLIHPASEDRWYREYLLTWVKGGIVYAVTGNGDYAGALELADSLE